ncbi:MAG: chemotaxis protein CheX [Rhodocyclaceae bacterium]|nr:chemotaxis protein CheX [Rhodocyclaceae bacterium]
MDEAQLRIFVSILQNYFERQTTRAAEVGTPFLGEANALPVFDYTGVIGISGARRGCVYFTAPGDLLRDLLLRVGESNVAEANLADLAGEIANTISGNARRDFGPDFMISVPVVVRGRTQSIQMPRETKAYVIPLRWQKHRAALVVGVN